MAGDAGVVGASTLASRVLGLVRDSVLAGCLSPTATDAFFTAFMIPNLLRRMVGEGALTLAFVPLFSGALRESRERARELFSRVWTLGLAGGLGLALLGIALADPLVSAFAPGFASTPGKHALTVELLRWCFPYILFMLLLSLAMGALNASGHFFRPAIAPTLLNVSMIAGTFAGVAWLDVPVVAVGIAVCVAGPLQLWLQRGELRRYALTPRLVWAPRDASVRRLGALLLPAVLGASVYQFNLLINRVLASLEGEGAVSYLSYADRLLELPLGVFVLALGTASLPAFSAYVKRGDRDALRASFASTLGLALALALPSSVGLIALREPIAVGLFRWNPQLFGPDAVAGVAVALLFYALGLLPITVSRMFVNLCVAHEDTRTGAQAAVLSLAVNVLASLALIGPLPDDGGLPGWLGGVIGLQHRLVLADLGYAGLALASSLAAAANAAYVAVCARARHGPVLPPRAWLAWLRPALASVALAAAGLGLVRAFPFPQVASPLGLALLGLYVGGAGVAYLAVLAALRAPEMRLLRELLRRRRG